MLFSSFEFLYLFLPLTVLVYFCIPDGGKNHVLLAASLVFYGIASPKLLPLLLIVSLADWLFGLFIEAQILKSRQRWANATVVCAVIFNVGILVFFKYLDPFLSVIGVSPLGIELPVGISFYIFQAMSYVFDVKRRAVAAQKNGFTFLTYVSLFPQLVAGPIVRYSDVERELTGRRHTLTVAADGLALFSLGLAKKVLLANGAGLIWERSVLLSRGENTVLCAWLGIIGFAFQIYFDFSGYSDMARGLGRLFGFEFPENFRYPYISRSITEFWRRWHITLSSWFREYVYIPLGGNRRSTARTYLNLLAVWSLTGIWHGASLNFLFWGLYFFAVLFLEKLFILKILKKMPSFAGHIYSLFLILIGWLIFASDGLSHPLSYFLCLFGVGCPLFNNDAIYEFSRNLPFLLIMAVGCTPLPTRIFEKLRNKSERWSIAVRNVLAVLSFLLCTCYLADSGYNPFLYFRF